MYGGLPGGGSPKRGRKSSGRVVAHLYNQVRRPSRFRGRLLFTIFGITGILCLIYGRKHAVDLSRTASSLKDYIPDSITDVIAQYGDFEEQRWDDGVDPENATSRIIKKPKFHLLIPANKPTENLCKTLLSAAILNYPPPTLISYGNKGQDTRPGADVVKNIFAFLHGKEVHEDDFILVVEEDAWFQLPAEVTINRFFHGLKDSNSKLLDKYGGLDHNENATRSSTQHQKYTMKVLFGSGKQCSNTASDPACYSVPESPLPKDIYGDQTDRHPEGKYNRPRYMSSAMVMGRVADLRPIYKEATEMLEFNDIGKKGSQYVFSEILGIQEYARTLSLASARNGPSKWRSWFSAVLSKSSDPSVNPPNITLKADKNYEFGIGLDYFSSVFQVMNNSAEDVRFVRFNHPSVIASPSRISAKAFKNPIRIPSDLALAPPPFFQNQMSSAIPDPPITELDNMHDDTALWTDIELSTNVIVPGSSVPASLNFHGSEYLLDGEMWEKMWFHPNARALMRQYIRSPDGPIAASAAAKGGDQWWDLRGGKGGVWTDRGEWLEWNEVCGAFDEKVFGDDKGEFMREKEEVGGQKVVYKFGQVVQGKLPKPKPSNLPNPNPSNMNAHKGLLGEAMKVGGAKPGSGINFEEPNITPPDPESHKTLLGEAAKAADGGFPGTGAPPANAHFEQDAMNPPKGLTGEVVQAGGGITTGQPAHITQETLDELKAKQDHLTGFTVGTGPPPSQEKVPTPMQDQGTVLDSQGMSVSAEQGAPMAIGGGMQVSGTMNLEKVKAAHEQMFQLNKGPTIEKPEGHGNPFQLDKGPANEKSEDEKKAEEIIKATEENNGDGSEGQQRMDDVVERID
ncbi:uncharacterized protein LY89DRAFT_719906 [Mollisia scopiformis]|uniref:Uncharacterized protein n=1 Tax=Mollisia scopiformis TaxID=149040 RepID=A0A194X583_MOLSC|nr:uncharacterized protein LY89DRAFT_719906 [Mollisia scopiformis]KUJ15336.1 hypothetical protein LY89DRAFT_719906 [Mollisia scopiformis]